MSKVSELVQSYVGGVEDTGETVGQTVTINLRARAQLEALSQIAKLSKTRTASQLLMAALEEAIISLPDKPMVYGNFYDNPESYPVAYTPQQFVEAFLDDVRYHDDNEVKGFVNSPFIDDGATQKETA
jgi:hypothetical protein